MHRANALHAGLFLSKYTLKHYTNHSHVILLWDMNQIADHPIQCQKNDTIAQQAQTQMCYWGFLEQEDSFDWL